MKRAELIAGILLLAGALAMIALWAPFWVVPAYTGNRASDRRH